MRISLFVAAIALGACTSPSSSGGGVAGCIPGATNLCLCAPGVQGVQACGPNGAGYLPCQCGPSGDAATSAETTAKADGTPSGETSAPTDVATAQDSATKNDAALNDATTDATTDDAIDWSELLDPEDTGSDAAPLELPPKSDAFSEDCPERAKIIYVVTKFGQLFSFTPDKLKFALVGALNCGFNGGTPFSMGVDREANAWVLYQSGLGQGGPLYKVSTIDAKCQPTNFTSGLGGFELFGMGFSADNPAGVTEKLFIGGGSSMEFIMGSCKLGTLDLKTMQAQAIGAFPAGNGCPDLTGNGNAELFGFFPQTNPAVVAQINKGTGKFTKSWPLPAGSFNGVEAWAFAQWGGKFWLFFQGAADATSAVWSLDPATGNAVKVLNNTGYIIVGAGVSSCAPTTTK